MKYKSEIDRLAADHQLPFSDWVRILTDYDDEDQEYAATLARQTAIENYGHKIFVRGLIEFTNYCRCDCYYCGIRKSNACAERYRLTPEEILTCCEAGYELGFRTFVLQGGEDGFWTDAKMISLIQQIKSAYPDCALTLSIGEKEKASYEAFFKAGANRYLLRHETANAAHYRQLHPLPLTAAHRQQCLRNLKEIGFQTGAGIMIGSPYQTPLHMAEDMVFMQDLQPHMVGIGPFLPQKETPFGQYPAGTLRDTLMLLSLTRLMLPQVLLPATTALSTIDPIGREKGVWAGANVVMPNLSPSDVRSKYMLYDNKKYAGAEAAEALDDLTRRMAAIGYEVVSEVGNHASIQ